MNGTDEGKKLAKMTGISWEPNGLYNLQSAEGISLQTSDFKKLKSRTVAVYWLATKSYPPDVKKKVEKLHVNATKASTKKGSDSSSDDKKIGATLKKLHLGCNEIVSVADVLPSLLRLTELCLEGNRITELPADIGRLSRLREPAKTISTHGGAQVNFAGDLYNQLSTGYALSLIHI